jgi:hypothetical protein
MLVVQREPETLAQINILLTKMIKWQTDKIFNSRLHEFYNEFCKQLILKVSVSIFVQELNICNRPNHCCAPGN